MLLKILLLSAKKYIVDFTDLGSSFMYMTNNKGPDRTRQCTDTHARLLDKQQNVCVCRRTIFELFYSFINY